MSRYLGLNRRSRGDRRMLDRGCDIEHRRGDRRRIASNSYVLVLGDSGVDRFGLMVGIPVLLLIAAWLASGLASF